MRLNMIRMKSAHWLEVSGLNSQDLSRIANYDATVPQPLTLMSELIEIHWNLMF